MFGKSWEMIKRGMAVALSVSLLAGAMSVSSSLPTAAASTKRVEVGTKGNVTINLDGREVWQAAADAMQKAQPVTGDIADRIMAQTGSNGNPVVLEDDIYKMELPAKALKGLPTGLGMEMYISAGAEDVAEDYTAAEEGEAAAVVAEVASASDLEATGVAEKPVRDFFASSMFSLIKENDEAAPAGGAAAAGGEGYELNGSEHIYFVLSNATDQDVNYTVKLGDLEILKTKVLKSHGDTTGVIGASVSDLIGVPASTSNMVRATESDMATASNLMEDAELTDDVVAKVVRTTLKNFFIIYRSEETALGTKAMVVTTADMKFKSKDGGVFTTRGDKMVLAVRDIDKNSEEYKQAAATLQNNNVDHADFAAVDISFRKGSADEDYEPCQGQIVNVRIETKAIENFDPESMSIQHHLDDGSLETVAGTTKKTVVEISDDAAEAVNNTVAVTEDQQTEITVEKKEDENVYTFDEEANKAAMEAQLSTAGKSEFKMEVGDGETALTNDVKESGAPKKASAAQTEVKKNSVTKTISSAVDANGVKTEVQEEQGNGDIKVEDGKVVADFVVDSFSIYTIVGQEIVTVDYLSADGNTYTVSVDLSDANIPEGAYLQVKELSDSEAEKYIEEAAKAVDKEAEDLLYSKALDISIIYNNKKIQPDGKVKVEVTLQDKKKDIRSEVVHFGEKSEVLDSNTDGKTVEFTTNGFSVFAIVGTETLTGGVVTADGSTYEVTVTYGPEAGIPTGATLEVSEVVSDSDDYEEYVEKTAEAVGSAADALNYIKLLDISIMYKNKKVQINAPVDVQIKLLDKEETEDRTKVVHFGEDETNVIEPEVDSDIVSFETSGFSIYAVTSYGETSNLDGKTFAIVHVNTQATTGTSTGNNTVYQGRALQNTASMTTRLAGATVNVETHESGLNIVTSGTTEISEWTFEKASGDNKYYIKASNGKYLNISANSDSLTLSDTAQEITVTEGTGNYAGSANQATSTTTPEFYGNNINDNNYIWMTLCEVQEIDPDQYPVYSGEKISVQDLVDGQKYIIYQNIYNETTGKYEDFVIDGNGRPVKAYDQGDSVSLHSEISPMWVLHICLNSNGEPNGYYIFRNEETGLCLKPMADGTLVAEYESDTTSGVALAGKEAGDYTSTIEFWDGSAMAWYGYQLTTTGDVVLSSATGSSSQKFSFAKEPESTTGLHEVATVDSTTAGITIRMFDYPDRATIANVTGSDSYGVGVLPAQHVSATLTNGYPTFTNGNSGSALFNPSNSYYKGTGNHLFLESVYDSTGYYEYSAFNNFAHYNQSDGTFTVYQETGTPSTTSNNFYYRRGNFFPYNTLNTNNSAQNIYTGDGTLIDYENPNYGSTLYGLSGTNFWFGMTMEFNFLMPKDGYDKGSPLIYEFNGDDDLWIYIDGVLILDIGGVHDAFPGTINFATGEITGGNGGAGRARTIKDCFKNAGVFPDGTAWNDSRVDEYFKGNTFVSYGSHQFNMFYMEHGAGASNLKTRFNLPVIEKGKVTVEKQLDNTSQVNYANVSFAYQAFAKNGGDFEPLTSAVYEGKTDSNGDPVPVTFYNNVVINEKTYNNVFYLKPTEAAVFSDLVEDEDYYVQEIGIDPTYYDEVYVNDVQIVGEQVIEEDGIYKSTEATPRNRARVTFTNRCDNRNSNELLITKRLAEGSEDNGDTFEFRVMLENAAGVLSAYYQGPYYIRDDEGVYYRYEGGQLVANGQSPYACTAGNFGTIAQIPPDYTVVIKDLVAGTDFYVDEIRVRPNGATSDVLIGNSEWELVSRETTENDPAEITEATIWDYATSRNITGSALGSIAWNKDAHVTFTNKYKTVDVQLKKVKEDGTTVLSGSVFDLAKYANSTWSNNIQTDITPGAEATATTEAVPNPVDLGNLGVGKYKLTETKSPDGYVIQTKYIYFEVYMETDKSLKARLIDENGTALTDAQIQEIVSKDLNAKNKAEYAAREVESKTKGFIDKFSKDLEGKLGKNAGKWVIGAIAAGAVIGGLLGKVIAPKNDAV